MQDECCQSCGGCFFRELEENEYRRIKEKDFKCAISQIKQVTPVFDEPVFISDGQRRRAEMSFKYTKKNLILGFNEDKTHHLVDIKNCRMLMPELNDICLKLRPFLEELCQIEITIKNKKKIEKKYVNEGSVYMLSADNGIDIILRTKENICLEHRLLIADFVNELPNICRFSWQTGQNSPETIVLKMPPELHIAGLVVEIPEGAFLQASKEAENTMIAKVMSYIGDSRGKTADLFCGLGTFTYPLAKESQDEIISVDSYEPSLVGLRRALNKNQLQNVRVINRNLFKYPFDKDDLKGVKTIVIDPPRAGAHEQCREIAKLKDSEKPQKIVFVSCNPKTFVYDAEQLINAGYIFERVTLVDQFVYSKHQELIALFVFNPNHKGE